MVVVKVQYSPTCPRCDKLLEELMKAGIQYGFEVLPEMVDTSYEPWFTKDDVSKIYNEEWFEKYGTEKQKRLYKKAKHFVNFLGTRTIVPIITIQWTYGTAERKLVVKGFQHTTSKQGIANLIRTILALIRLERRVDSERFD